MLPGCSLRAIARSPPAFLSLHLADFFLAFGFYDRLLATALSANSRPARPLPADKVVTLRARSIILATQFRALKRLAALILALKDEVRQLRASGAVRARVREAIPKRYDCWAPHSNPPVSSMISFMGRPGSFAPHECLPIPPGVGRRAGVIRPGYYTDAPADIEITDCVASSLSTSTC